MGKDTLKIPDDIVTGAEYVMDRARSVSIDESALVALADAVERRLERGIDTIETAFGTTGNLAHDVNIVFFETVVNFCFWADKNEDKWEVERDGVRLGGWYSLAACFERAISNGVPVYDAAYMANLTPGEAERLFAGIPGGAEIPLLDRRVKNLNEAGAYLLRAHDGQAMHLLESVDFSASRLAEKVTQEIASFRDGAVYNGRWVWILKRAQILAGDLAQLSARYPQFQIHDVDQLTAFADYRLPQIFRHFDVFIYSKALDERIDALEHIAPGEPCEVEIRAATIVASEQLKGYLPTRSSADIDIGLWLMSQDMRDDPQLRPHHRTPGWFY